MTGIKMRLRESIWTAPEPLNALGGHYNYRRARVFGGDQDDRDEMNTLGAKGLQSVSDSDHTSRDLANIGLFQYFAGGSGSEGLAGIKCATRNRILLRVATDATAS